jgi:hypothetical protein
MCILRRRDPPVFSCFLNGQIGQNLSFFVLAHKPLPLRESLSKTLFLGCERGSSQQTPFGFLSGGETSYKPASYDHFCIPIIHRRQHRVTIHANSKVPQSDFVRGHRYLPKFASETRSSLGSLSAYSIATADRHAFNRSRHSYFGPNIQPTSRFHPLEIM